MKRLLPLALALLTAGCVKIEHGKQDAGSGEVQGGTAAHSAAPVEYFHVDAATAGTLTGAITFRGAKPAREVISMEAEQGCQQANAGKPVYDPGVLTGKNGGLANAFVYIQAGLEGKKFEPVKEPAVVLDQHGCMFLPRVIGLRAGQTLDLKNGDSVSHNIHPIPVNNREWNQEQPPHAADVEHRFARPEVMIPVKCNIHAWMHAWIGVVDHPYFAVTGPDGSFEWKNVPPGDYTVSVWHEKLGVQTQQVHLAPTASAAVNFTYR
jgi:plastocyanin